MSFSPPQDPSARRRDDAARRARRGAEAEELTARRLVDVGFVIVARNVHVGRLELDIVAHRPGLHVFVEVRSRTTVEHGHPAESVDRAKRTRVRRAASAWLRANGVATAVRFDVATVVFDRDGIARAFHYYANAF